MSFEKACVDALKKIQGSYALLAISEDTRRVVAARKDLPLVIGLVEGGTVFASDASVLQRLAHKAVHLRNYDVAVACKREVEPYVRTKTFKFRRGVWAKKKDLEYEIRLFAILARHNKPSAELNRPRSSSSFIVDNCHRNDKRRWLNSGSFFKINLYKSVDRDIFSQIYYVRTRAKGMEGTDLKQNHLLLYFFILSIFIMSDSGTCIDASRNYDSMGNKLYSVGNYSEAMDYFNKSIDQNSSYVDAWVHKGNAQKALRYYNASLLSYNRAIASDSKNAAAWSGLSDSYSAGKDYANASAAAAALTRIDPKNKGYWFKNGTLLQVRGDFIRAKSDFDQALALDAKYKDALYRKAISELAANETDQAIELFDQVIAVDAKYKQAYNAKGQALEAQGKYELAITAYDRALKIDPKWTLPLVNKMHAMIATGNRKEAVDIFLRA